MHIGLVGLGKMGGNMRTRMRNAGLTVIGYDRDPERQRRRLARRAGRAAAVPKVVWVMVPAGEPTQQHGRRARASCSAEGDVVVDGGNSRWTDDEKHAALARREGHRLRRLRCERRRLGPRERLRADGRRRRRRHREGAARVRRPASRGRVRLRPRRPGRRRALLQDGPQRHRVRHDAGLRRGLRAAREGRHRRQRHRGASTPGARARSSARGCSTCWSRRLQDDPGLSKIRGYAEDSGEGRWTVEAAIDQRRARSTRSPPRCSPGSCPARTSRRRCRPSPRCASSSAATPSRPPPESRVHDPNRTPTRRP